MPGQYKTPDVYIEEISVFPPSVAEVETAIPAFIGYTAQATRTGANDLRLRPTKIHSLKEYEDLFGGPHAPAVTITVEQDADGALRAGAFTVGGQALADDNIVPYLTYHAVRLYFDNGGGQCYIVSVGGYADAVAWADGIEDGLAAVALEDEPTLLLAPEAVHLDAAGYGSWAQAALLQCGTLKDRFALFDVYRGYLDLEVTPSGELQSPLVAARAMFGSNHLKYGAAYYPYLRTTVTPVVAGDGTNVAVTYTLPDGGGTTTATLDTLRTTATSVYNLVKATMRERFLVLPPTGAVAGVYAATDTARGVWKAPANVSLTDVLEPVVRLSNQKQEPLNVDADGGKSINAIRAFSGKGTLVWGARTLAGNDNEWRYVSVRRFFNMVEESVKKSTYWAVFEPNDANLWVKVRGMIENYLTQKWREGALAGAAPKDAFFVRCGLGTTMSAVDILEGRLNVEVGLAVVRPAEFIVLRFSHKLQTS